MEVGREEEVSFGVLVQTEHQIQSAFMDWVSWQVNRDERYSYFVKVPNEGKRSFWTCGRMKKEGLTAGLPDLLCLWPMTPYPGLAIEFKTVTGKITAKQREWEQKLISAGWLHEYCRSVNEAIKITQFYFREA